MIEEPSRGRDRIGDSKVSKRTRTGICLYTVKGREKHQRIRVTRKYQAKRSGDVVRGSNNGRPVRCPKGIAGGQVNPRRGPAFDAFQDLRIGGLRCRRRSTRGCEGRRRAGNPRIDPSPIPKSDGGRAARQECASNSEEQVSGGKKLKQRESANCSSHMSTGASSTTPNVNPEPLPCLQAGFQGFHCLPDRNTA